MYRAVSRSETPIAYICGVPVYSRNVNDEWSATKFFDVLDDEFNREILAATSVKPMSANELLEMFEMSKPTVYRRIDELEELDMLKEQLVVDRDGNHYRVFKANLDSAEILLEDGHFDVTVHFREDVADRFTRLWEGIRGE